MKSAPRRRPAGRHALAAAAFLLLPAACAAPTAPGTHLPGTHLADSTWQFIRIDGAAPVSHATHLAFTGRTLSADIGCNEMGGPWRIAHGRLLAGPLVQTEMYCAGPVWQQEQAVSALLAGAPRLSVQGDRMTLASSGHSAQLVRRPRARP